MKAIITILLSFVSISPIQAENGYELWLRYHRLADPRPLAQFLTAPAVCGNSPVIAAAREELTKALSGLTGHSYTILSTPNPRTSFIAGTPASSRVIPTLVSSHDLAAIGEEGFIITNTISNGRTAIAANTDIGVLYGIFHFIRLLQTQQPLQRLHIVSTPKIKLRLLDHWDNLDRTVERGYAGASIWNWHHLPDVLDQRYTDYARANASIGINGAVLTNVNADAQVLTRPYLEKVKALAGVFRPYGIKVYLTARFSAPVEIGGLRTADPLNDTVQLWWKEKAREIYSLVPDFGGFLVKANSEGQPGPQDYSRTHADGANMLAAALAPFRGIVMWRAFVYSQQSSDRFKQAYEEFTPLDGRFSPHVLVQVKNGPIDFQPREPFSPLFGAMPHTPLMMEFQLTQEYTGQGTHLLFEAPMFREVLDADTYSKGSGSTIARTIDGSLDQFPLSGMAGVSNIGSDINWCGHPFAQANWYALGRLSWDHSLSSAQIADEWLRQTFTNDPAFVVPVKKIMLRSHDLLVNYMTPLGLAHIMYNGHHYGPMPWGNSLGRPDWNPVYYHRADSTGIGFNRTETGSNALSQYAPELQAQFGNLDRCPEEYLFWFHHVPWQHRMRSGRTCWEELCYRYYAATDSMKAVVQAWGELGKYIDTERYHLVQQLLNVQLKEAIWWRNACLLYFQTFSRKPIPGVYEQPDHPLEYYRQLRFVFVPGQSK